MLLAYPRVVAACGRHTVRLRAEKPLFTGESYTALFTACEVFKNEQEATQGEMISGFEVFHTTNKPRELAVRVKSPFECLVEVECPDEQEYILRVAQKEGGTLRPVGCACLYAVEQDFQGLLPYKGDLHMHSYCSDGENAPQVMAAACREKGFDFMALTDHGKFEPSLELRRQFAAMPELAMELYAGEEIHLPWHQAHILNIGGRASVNEAFLSDREGFLRQVEEMGKNTAVPEGVDRYQYLAALWAFDRVRREGGLSVFCHPYWRRPSGFELCAEFTEAMLAARPFDALEVVSGYGKADTDSNLLQLARYFELEPGARPPIVGVSDAHAAFAREVPAGEYLLGAFYTVVLAKTNRFEDVAEAIRAHRSLAVEEQEHEQRHVYGPYRLVKYAQFLARQFFPEHDALAAREAAAMGRFARGLAARGEQAAMEELYAAAFEW
ncbi:PHP domain-containing protein [Allofournierella sp.]|uniref:PHP domain-containing protein n=1 Tax=Allofournierella sp. TaxID=1940256 RepID=UPI003AB1EF04